MNIPDSRRRQLMLVLGTAWCGLPAAADAATLSIGDTLPALTLEDQHGQPVLAPGAARWLLFAPDKPAADLAQAWLQPRGAGVLSRLQAVYLADISGMPALVTRLFALPKLRELPFPVGMVREASLTASIPRQGRVTQIQQAVDIAALGQALGT
jgi:NADPH-dependent ferric siderophore reductase